MDLDAETRTALEAAAFRRLVEHLRARTDVQNIDLMNLAGFCRNCLGNWYAEAAVEHGLPMSRDEGREEVYGMPSAEWKARYQRGHGGKPQGFRECGDARPGMTEAGCLEDARPRKHLGTG